MTNFSRYNAHKPKFFGGPHNLEEHNRGPKTRDFEKCSFGACCEEGRGGQSAELALGKLLRWQFLLITGKNAHRQSAPGWTFLSCLPLPEPPSQLPLLVKTLSGSPGPLCWSSPSSGRCVVKRLWCQSVRNQTNDSMSLSCISLMSKNTKIFLCAYWLSLYFLWRNVYSNSSNILKFRLSFYC